MIGLNNMHRRRVRTGLTCATLTLLTFVDDLLHRPRRPTWPIAR